jgi:hypothetical protein
MIRVVHPGSRILMLTFSHPGSRGQKGRYPIPDPGSGSATLLACFKTVRNILRIRSFQALFWIRAETKILVFAFLQKLLAKICENIGENFRYTHLISAPCKSGSKTDTPSETLKWHRYAHGTVPHKS